MIAAPLSIDFDALPADARVLVGYSGGLDSTVLLHLLAQQLPRERLRALHVHHGLHADADAWTQHCGQECAQLGVALDVVRVEVARDSSDGLEAAARHARHSAYARVLHEGEVLALAHHRDDQAETFLLRALRASGVDGLASMRAWRPYADGFLWRPLLAQPRAALLAWAQAEHLRWIDDASNADTDLDRNFLRHRVLPVLRERWPHADAMFARSAALVAEATDLLADEDAAALASVGTTDSTTLSVPMLLALPATRRTRVLRRWIALIGLPPLPAQGVAHIEADLLQAAAGAEAAFAWAGASVRRWRDLLHAAMDAPPLPSDWSVVWRGDAPLTLPDGATLALLGAPAFERPLQVRARQGGERIILPARTHSHALKHVLQDLGVPPWLREHLPLLTDLEGQVLAAGDLVHSAEFACWLQDRGARLSWSRGPSPD
jgi:tRNA(Ile)-lysidine synthase